MADTGGEPPVATSAVLYAAARELARVCGRVNADFLACKAKDENPAACLAEGERVQRCSLNLIKELSAQCPSELTGYAACIDRQTSIASVHRYGARMHASGHSKREAIETG